MPLFNSSGERPFRNRPVTPDFGNQFNFNGPQTAPGLPNRSPNNSPQMSLANLFGQLQLGPTNNQFGGLEGLVNLANQNGGLGSNFNAVRDAALRLAPERFDNSSPVVIQDRLRRLFGETGNPLFDSSGNRQARIDEPGGGGGAGGALGQGQAGGFQLPGIIRQLSSTLKGILSNPQGLSEDALARQQNLINTSSAQREQQGLANLSAQFNTAGQLGGGQLGRQSQLFSQNINQENANQTNQLAAFNEQLAQQQLQSAIQGALGIGQLGLGQGQLGLGFGDLNLRRELGLGDLDLRRFLGTGQLNLGQQNFDLANQSWLADQALTEFLLGQGNFGLGG